jgi:thiamine biosynthesis lipoprotein
MKYMNGRSMNRRAFLKLPALLPLVRLDSSFPSGEHHFQYECILGTSLDLMVWTQHSRVADGVCQTVLEEIDRLARILNTRDPASEITLLENSNAAHKPSRELKDVLDAYDYWERRTGGVLSIRPAGPDTPRNVDALGKAYIIDQAARAAREAWPSLDALLLNVGGDIVVWGRSCEIGIADPAAWYDNSPPIATIDLQNAAVATSGSYARGAHLTDPRTGQSSNASAAATVVAADAVAANALATTLCLVKTDGGLRFVEETPGAEAMRVVSGIVQRTSGFTRLARPVVRQATAPSNWPSGYQLKVTLPLTSGRSKERPYVGVWVEDSAGKLVSVLAIFGTKSKYYPDLSTMWRYLKGPKDQFRSVTRATKSAGRYEFVWDGLDRNKMPVPPGSYTIIVETNQEHGTYAKQAGEIVLGESPASITLPATANFEQVLIQYGPK